LGVADPHLAQQFDDALVKSAPPQPAVQPKRFGDLLSDGQGGVQRRHGVLQDHRDPRAAQLAHLFPALGQQILPFEGELAAHDAPARLGDEPQD
jgi:hypothetical protein